MRGKIRCWSVWGLADKKMDVCTTALVVVVLVWSRFAWLPSGPWEWDETLFARGMLHFELAAHFPHPPGFPGWLAIGHLLMPFAGQPLESLQWASAAFSILALWPLMIIGRRVAQPAIAAAASLIVLFLPGPWLFSVRGFSSTAAATLALAAAAIWVGGLKGRRATAFSSLIALSFLVRPILLPALLVLWFCGVGTVRKREELIPGIVVGVSLIVLAVTIMVHLEGSWPLFLEPFSAHAGSHAARLHLNDGGLADLGLVKGFGGLGVAAILFFAASWGVFAWGRQLGRAALVSWLLIMSALIGPLLFLQNRTYARYATPVQLATAPLLAGALASLPAAPASAVLIGVALVSGWWSWPLLEEQHQTLLPAWGALLEAEERARAMGWAVVVDPEVHPFASYRWHVLQTEGAVPPQLELSPRSPEGWAGIDRPWIVASVHPHLYLPSVTGQESSYGGVSSRLEGLSQQRFLDAVVLENPPLPVGQWWNRAELEDGTPFMWAGPEAELWLPPVPADTVVGLDFRPAPGDTDVVISLDGNDAISISGRSGRRWLWFRRKPGNQDRPLILGFDRPRGYAPGGDDLRELSVQVFGTIVRPLGMAYGGPISSSRERERLRLIIDGAYEPENFGKHGSGVWLRSEAQLRLAVEEPGLLTVSLRSPRPTDSHVQAELNGAVVASDIVFLKGQAQTAIPIGPKAIEGGVVEIILWSEPFVPAKAGLGADTRELGVVLTAVTFQPNATGSLCWWDQGTGENR